MKCLALISLIILTVCGTVITRSSVFGGQRTSK